MPDLMVTVDRDICKFTLHQLPDRPGIAAEMLGRLGEAGINVILLAASGSELGRTDISVVVNQCDLERVPEILESVKKDLGAERLSQRTDVAAISLVASGLSHASGIAGRMFRILSGEGINIDMISAANTAVTCLIDSRFVGAAKNALEQDFAIAAKA